MSRKFLGYVITIVIIIGLLSIMVNCIEVQESSTKIIQKEDKTKMIAINEVLMKNLGGLQDEDGDYNDWIELYNCGDEEINLSGYGLSDDLEEPYKWVFPDWNIGAKSFVVIMASGKDKSDSDTYLHTNFKLNKDGEFIVLTHPDGETIDYFKVSASKENVSYGREPDGNDRYAFLSKSTPGKANNVSIRNIVVPERRLETPKFSKEGGFYNEKIYIELSVDDEDTKIYYTLDGSEPTTSSCLYTKPIEISSREGEPNKLSKIQTTDVLSFTLGLAGEETYKGTVVRARTYKDGVISDEIITNSYFINPNYTLPVISIVTDEDNLFGYENGIYVPGKIYDEWVAKNKNTNVETNVEDIQRNYNQKGKGWEREAHIEFFESNGCRGLSQNVGIRISGAYTRMELCKSLEIFARKEYDDKNTINYDLFSDLTKRVNESEAIDSFKNIKLRNSGNDFGRTMFKDALLQSLVEDIGIDTQAYRPTILFINGEYWGIHNLRENCDEYYIQNHYDIDKSDVVILSAISDDEEVDADIYNDLEDYDEMIRFIKENDMTEEKNYQYVESQMDIDNFIKYTVSQIYFFQLGLAAK